MEMVKERKRLPMYGVTIWMDGKEIIDPIAEGYFTHVYDNHDVVFFVPETINGRINDDVWGYPFFMLSQEDIAWNGRLDCFADPEAAKKHFGV